MCVRTVTRKKILHTLTHSHNDRKIKYDSVGELNDDDELRQPALLTHENSFHLISLQCKCVFLKRN